MMGPPSAGKKPGEWCALAEDPSSPGARKLANPQKIDRPGQSAGIAPGKRQGQNAGLGHPG